MYSVCTRHHSSQLFCVHTLHVLVIIISSTHLILESDYVIQYDTVLKYHSVKLMTTSDTSGHDTLVSRV